MQRVEMRKGGLPRTIDRTVALIGDHNIKISACQLRVPTDHSLQETNRDLLFLTSHAWAEPITTVLVEHVLDRFYCLFR